MIDQTQGWYRFEPANMGKVEGSQFAPAYGGQTVLVTGAAGDIGSTLVRALQPEQLNRLLLLDSSEHGLFELQRQVAKQTKGACCEFILGTISDEYLIRSVLSRFKPDCVFHAAAFKHVGMLERNVRAAIDNNALGTYQLAKAAAEHGVTSFLLLSTDKAVNPSSVLGVSKLLAERFVLTQSTRTFRANVIRLVNVIGSRGSVIPLLLEQIRRNEPLTITHKDASRYFLSRQETVDVILEAGHCGAEGKVFVPNPGPTVCIKDIANFLAQKEQPGCKPAVHFSGLAEGEKLQEALYGEDETPSEGKLELVQEFDRPRWSPELAAQLAGDLDAALNDNTRLINLLRTLVPDYLPSALVLAQADSATKACD